MPEEENLEATLENGHWGCRRDMLRQTVPSTSSSNREGLWWTAVYNGHSETV